MPAKLTRADRVNEIAARIEPPTPRHIEPDIISFAVNTLRFTQLDSWQSDFLTDTQHKRVILNCARQTGKSSMVAIRAIYEALTTPGSLILVISPTFRQSMLLFSKIMRFYDTAERPILPIKETETQLRLENDSWIVSLPSSEANVRGFSKVDFIAVDEAARVGADVYAAIMPMLLVSGGRIVMLSTPWGYDNFYSDVWHNNDNDWHKVKITADACPRITKEAIAIQRENMLSWQIDQELYCSFESSQLSLLSESAIKSLFAEHVELWSL
jgi:tRNA(Met) C34 N-acetyltransferase TmcA